MKSSRPTLLNFSIYLFFLPFFLLFTTEVEAQETALGWLNGALSCEELSSNIRKRYSGIGNFAELSKLKQVELRYVLDTACSERFKHCNFSNCKRDADPSIGAGLVIERQPAESGLQRASLMDSANEEIDPLERQRRYEERMSGLAMQVLSDLFAAQRSAQQQLITQKAQEEAAAGVDWRVVKNPGEQATVSSRYSQIRERREQKVKATVVSGGNSFQSTGTVGNSQVDIGSQGTGVAQDKATLIKQIQNPVIVSPQVMVP